MQVKYAWPNIFNDVTRACGQSNEFNFIPVTKTSLKPFPEVHPFVDVIWKDGLTARSQCNNSINWDNVVAWAPCEINQPSSF